MSAMPYRTFLIWNAVGGLCWGVSFTMAGYLAGKSYESVVRVAGTASTAIIVLVAISILALVIWRKARARRATNEADDL